MLSTYELARVIGGRALGADGRFNSVTTDSRTIEEGALFIALRGERFDGHDFAAEALRRGAVAALVDVESKLAGQIPNVSLVEVGDTKAALGRFAAWWRARFGLPLIGVVGSNGKTTVKEMIASILHAQFGDASVLSTAGNLNNDIGVPLTLLRLRLSHRVGVIEIGMNHPGETAVLAGIARPTIGLINNAQREHQEFMGSVEEVAAEHGALIAALPPDGVAIINADDAHAGKWRALVSSRAIRTFGLHATADVSGKYDQQGMQTRLTISMPEGTAQAALHIPGLHNVGNALAAAAATSAVGCGVQAIGYGLTAFRPAKGRLQQLVGARGQALIDDTYNANPDSVLAAIDILASIPGPRILVLGDMGEVGAQGGAYHAEVGRYAREQGIDRLFCLGEQTKASIASFGAGGEHFMHFEALMKRLLSATPESATILVKGSRFMRMERVIAQLQSGESACS